MLLGSLCGCLIGCTVTVSSRPPPPRPPPRSASAPTPQRVPAAPRAAAPFERVQVDPDAEVVLRRSSASRPFLEAEPPALTRRALDGSARGEARGMVGEGVRFTVLAEGENASTPIQLRTGDCITVIAHGGLGVMEVDAMLVRRSGATLEILAGDRQNGPVGMVGGRDGCFIYTGPSGQAELLVQARRGGGPVVTELFRSR